MANFWENDPVASPFDTALYLEGVTGKKAELARSIYAQESSSGKNTTTSNAGAVGGMQIIPSTFASVADKGWDIKDPVQNARAGLRYVNKLWDIAGEDPRLAAIGYYGGPGAIAKARKGVAVSDPRNPKAPNTLQYGDSVVSRMAKLGDDIAKAVIPSAQAGTLDAPWENDPIVSQDGAGAQSGAVEYSDGKGDKVRLNYDEPQERTTAQSLGRQIGLTARAGLQGIASMPEMIVNPFAQMAGLPEMKLGNTLDALGFPEPENSTERVAQDVTGALTGAGGISKLAQSVATPLVKSAGQSIASLLGSNVGTQLGTAAAGAGSAGTAREMGAGPVGQTIAGLAGGMAYPLAGYVGPAAVRGAVRGGEAGRQTVERNIEEFRKAGTTPSVGQATQKSLMQGTESVLSQAPGGAGVMARKAASQTDDISHAVDSIVGKLTPNAGAVEAGESVTRGLEGFKAGVKDVQKRLYERLDDYLPENTPVPVKRTQDALAKMSEDIGSAKELSRMFKNAKIGGIERSLTTDLERSARAQMPAGGSLFNPARPDVQNATLPYEAIKKLRTLVGQEIDNANFTSDVPRDKWRALYGALSEDLGDAAGRAGPEAFDAWRWANQFTRDQVGRLDELAGIAGRDTPEKIFNAAMAGSADGDTVLRRVVSAIPKENRRDLAAAVIRRMGRATAGNQNEAGDAFSVTTFLTNWSKLSPQARQTLFGRVDDPELLGKLENLARVATNIRDGSRYLANPSGTAPAAARYGVIGAAAMAGLTGNWPALAAIGGGVVGANRVAHAFTHPNFVRQMAKKTKVNPLSVLGAMQGLVPRD